jgi:hypothetical protein
MTTEPPLSYTLEGSVWLYPGDSAAWHCITLPPSVSAEIYARFRDKQRNWGSIAVRVSVGKSVWTTSIFRDTKKAAYVLPLKAAIRKKERLQAGDYVSYVLTIMPT